MTPTVNVLYIRGVVEALARFAPLLTEHTGWSYRLIANGCTPDELSLLERIAAGSDRLSVYNLGKDTVLPHSETLCLLADTFTDEPFFAFMDSDVVVTGDVTAELTAHLEQHDAVFTGSTIWARPQDTVLRAGQPKACGPHERTDGGIVLGHSYFAVYHRSVFDDVRRRCQVGPGKYRKAWLTDLADGFRDHLVASDLIFDDYTPPKVLNLAYGYTGHSVVGVDSDDVHHIGGYSLATLHQQNTQPDLDAVASMIDSADVRPHTALKIAVCDRVMRSFAAIDATGRPWRGQTFDPPLEDRIRLIEDLYARQAHLVSH